MANMSRRDFVRTGMLAGLTAEATGQGVFGQAPAVSSGLVRPVVIASRNGNQSSRECGVFRSSSIAKPMFRAND